ncbi:MAG: DUF362 domain-containing protein [Firmicutes bacterium]|nr:DUF362 domain-containing protein [Bacillota bacterium]
MSSKVYLTRLNDGSTPEEQAKAVEKLFDACNVSEIIDKNNFVAIKVHVGEKNNTTHVPPEVPAVLVKKAKEKEAIPFLTETSTLYRGERENAVKHIMHAIRHGFTVDKIGAPFVMADGLAGNSEIEVEIDGELNKTVKVAREARMTDVLLVVTHSTGHIVCGYGGTIKNLGMGLASRKGKLRQHSTMAPEIDRNRCVMCGRCIKWCPEDAITAIDKKAYIHPDKCVGCGECLAVCQFDAVKFNWGAESSDIQRQMAEHAYGVVKGKESKCFYFNVMINMTQDCDCMGIVQEKIIPDIGILASADPVAIDEAALDLTLNNGKDLVKASYEHLNGRIQLAHAEKIGMGSRKYEIVEI